jgi:lipopolysaccharide assembly outer membrane protein LptD (OstA)
MVFRPSIETASLSRTLAVRAALTGFLAFAALSAPVQAALLPEGFFDMQVSPGEGPAAVEADRLNYDGRLDVISAEGNVLFSYQGYTIRADRLEYNQQTGDLFAVGGVVLRDPMGTTYESNRIEVTGEMKNAFFDSQGRRDHAPRCALFGRAGDDPHRGELFAVRPLRRRKGPADRLEG